MRWGGRVAAAIEILNDVLDRHRPASEALADWGRGHRFAGAKDRHAVGTLVFDSLRKRNSLASIMGDSSPRALALGAVAVTWGRASEEITGWAQEPHGPGELTADERARLLNPVAGEQPPWVAGDYPQWLQPSFERVFGTEAAQQGAALAE